MFFLLEFYFIRFQSTVILAFKLKDPEVRVVGGGGHSLTLIRGGVRVKKGKGVVSYIAEDGGGGL